VENRATGCQHICLVKRTHMKYFFGILAIAFLGMACKNDPAAGQGAATGAGKGPMFSVNEEVHDYGTITEGADGSCTFTVTNTGDAPLIISKCEKTCGCTVPQCDPTPIAPGATSEIKVTYDTKRVGPFNKNVKVFCNSADGEEKTLRIKGEVVKP
jgi:Protein of unknown function (DUF1573)